MYRLLCGRVPPTVLPPTGETEPASSTAADVIPADRVPPTRPPHHLDRTIDRRLSQLVTDCLQSDPGGRPASMSTVMRRLDNILRRRPPRTAWVPVPWSLTPA